jgi:hypothetical protein
MQTTTAIQVKYHGSLAMYFNAESIFSLQRNYYLTDDNSMHEYDAEYAIRRWL